MSEVLLPSAGIEGADAEIEVWSAEATETRWVPESVEMQLTDDIFDALTVRMVEAVSAPEVRVMSPPEPNVDTPVATAPL